MAKANNQKPAHGCGPWPKNRCCPRTTSKARYTLAELVEEFLSGQNECCRDEIAGYREKPLRTAIIMAARADDGYGNLHPHQKWLWPKTARAAESILLKCIADIVAESILGAILAFVTAMTKPVGAPNLTGANMIIGSLWRQRT